MRDAEDAVPTEVSVSASVGGKVQVVKYEQTSDYHFSVGGRWAVPDFWTNDDCENFRQEQLWKLRKELEPFAQHEYDDLMDQREKIQ